MIIYIYSKCSTCQEALRFLKQKNVEFTAIEIVKIPPTISELRKMLDYQDGNIKKLFNTSGMQYRDMKLSEKLPNMTLEDSLTLLSQNGMLVKRPFVLGENFGLLGFKKEQWGTKF